GPTPAPSTARSAWLVTVGILLSKVAGLLRQRLIGHYFGLSAVADVLGVAFRIGNITQNLLGEGTLSASFIPVYARLPPSAQAAPRRRFPLPPLGFLIPPAAAASTVGVILAPLLTHAFASGLAYEPSRLVAKALQILFPMTGILVLSAWGLGVLNAHRRFFL